MKKLSKKCNLMIETLTEFQNGEISLSSIGEDNEADALIVPQRPVSRDISSVYYITDIHLDVQIMRKFPKGSYDFRVKSYIKSIVRKMFSNDLVSEIRTGQEIIVLFGGDISSVFEVNEIFFSEFMMQWKKYSDSCRQSKQKIYAILGNHEVWEFETLAECTAAYEKLFSQLNINFLDNKIVSICNNEIIVGGIGFAGQNEKYNANMGLYRNTISRKEEIEESRKWEKVYKKGLDLAEEKNSVLIVLTHNPIKDWKTDETTQKRCIYFNGHTHNSFISHNEDMNIHIYADNQIGYYNRNIKFKKAYIDRRINPFAVEDGYYSITIEQYRRFYAYMNERLGGVGSIEKQMEFNNADFYLVKHNGYYGFFLITNNTTFICAGGRIKRVSNCTDINWFDSNFIKMIDIYLDKFSPFRKIQEQIANKIKAIGGEGFIHGTIIDIDFLNHIMVNPMDGTITYYYSPRYGEIEPYNSLPALLSHRNPKLAENYKEVFKESENVPAVRSSQLQKIDIKNSIYAVSNRLNQVQRLFDKKILRDWNEELLFSEKSRNLLE